jgi:predicted tellurium resistance membrane protein TerC
MAWSGTWPLAGVPWRVYRGTVARSNESIPITGAQVPLSEDQRQRTRRYLISMAIRTVCFIAAIVASGWLRWALVAGAVFLPYIAVIMANAGRTRSAPAAPMIILNEQRQIESHKTD